MTDYVTTIQQLLADRRFEELSRLFKEQPIKLDPQIFKDILNANKDAFENDPSLLHPFLPHGLHDMVRDVSTNTFAYVSPWYAEVMARCLTMMSSFSVVQFKNLNMRLIMYCLSVCPEGTSYPGIDYLISAMSQSTLFLYRDNPINVHYVMMMLRENKVSRNTDVNFFLSFDVETFEEILKVARFRDDIVRNIRMTYLPTDTFPKNPKKRLCDVIDSTYPCRYYYAIRAEWFEYIKLKGDLTDLFEISIRDRDYRKYVYNAIMNGKGKVNPYDFQHHVNYDINLIEYIFNVQHELRYNQTYGLNFGLDNVENRDKTQYKIIMKYIYDKEEKINSEREKQMILDIAKYEQTDDYDKVVLYSHKYPRLMDDHGRTLLDLADGALLRRLVFEANLFHANYSHACLTIFRMVSARQIDRLGTRAPVRMLHTDIMRKLLTFLE